MNCDVQRPTLEIPTESACLQPLPRSGKARSSVCLSSFLETAHLRKCLGMGTIPPGHHLDFVIEKTSYQVRTNRRDISGIKTHALPCALSSSKKCNWPSSSFHNKVWFWKSKLTCARQKLVLTAFLKTNLSLQNKSQSSESSKQRSTASVAASKTWVTGVAKKRQFLRANLSRLRTRQAWNLSTSKNLPEICNDC